MTNFIATWFYASPPGERIYYPGVGDNSDSWAFKKTYWHCILTFFDRIHRIYSQEGLSLRPLLFLNSAPPLQEISSQIDLSDFFNKCLVDIKYFSPAFHGVESGTTFSSQFYIYDVLRSAYAFMEDDDTITLLDSDVLPLLPLSSDYFASLKCVGQAFYPLKWPSDFVNNGLTLDEFTSTLMSLFNDKDLEEDAALDFARNSVSYFLGGEFLAFSKPALGIFLDKLDSVSDYVVGDSVHQIRTEEHLNTIVQLLLDQSFIDASSLVRRVWTDPTKFFNVEDSDRQLPFVHLPAEKLQGFYRYYHEVILGMSGPDGFVDDGLSDNIDLISKMFRI